MGLPNKKADCSPEPQTFIMEPKAPPSNKAIAPEHSS